MIETIQMSAKQRCKLVITGIKETIGFVLKGHTIDVKMVQFGKEDFSIDIDGWITITPVVEIPKPKIVSYKYGKTHTVTYSEQKPLWALTISHFIPATRHEPEDVDVEDISTDFIHDSVKLAIDYLVKNLIRIHQENQMEKYHDEMVKVV